MTTTSSLTDYYHHSRTASLDSSMTSMSITSAPVVTEVLPAIVTSATVSVDGIIIDGTYDVAALDKSSSSTSNMSGPPPNKPHIEPTFTGLWRWMAKAAPGTAAAMAAAAASLNEEPLNEETIIEEPIDVVPCKDEAPTLPSDGADILSPPPPTPTSDVVDGAQPSKPYVPPTAFVDVNNGSSSGSISLNGGLQPGWPHTIEALSETHSLSISSEKQLSISGITGTTGISINLSAGLSRYGSVASSEVASLARRDCCRICLEPLQQSLAPINDDDNEEDMILEEHEVDRKSTIHDSTTWSSEGPVNFTTLTVDDTLSTALPFSNTYTCTSCDSPFCHECVSRYYTFKVENGESDRMHCPDCDRVPSEFELRNFLSKSSYSKYLIFEKRARLELDPNVCWCPRPDCETAIRRDPSQPSTHVQCPLCGIRFCFLCRERDHGRRSCRSARRSVLREPRNENEKLFETYAHQHTRKCPNCRCKIEKVDNGLCNHMICSVCRTEFCWLCGRKIPPLGHFDKNNPFGCPGMQYGIQEAGRIRRTAERAKVIGRYGGKATLFTLALPLFAIAAAPVGIYFGVRAIYRHTHK